MLLRHISPASSSHWTAKLGAHTDAQRHQIRRHVCSSARNAAQNACVCLQELMETSISALATITGRPRTEDPNVLEK
ncbi:hypothetical protein Dsin_005294 [Dipteronia sinensis]|uniref:Uncharacterized protein n=1 Tax=Dipteronia sinensis TaxID=43782 RepID=A0AAE0AXJ5_9ROSI|nr:hypothetical protein Dsin_005294 [Dipteronia sinensis]